MWQDITGIRTTDHRNDRRQFGVKREDRFLHIQITGKTGTGKSTLLGNIATQDMAADNGFALLDPHGDLFERLHQEAIATGRQDIIYLNATDPSQL